MKKLVVTVLLITCVTVGWIWIKQGSENQALLTETLDGADTFWVTSMPEEHGMDSAKLAKVVQGFSEMSSSYAVLVIKDQKLIVERYFHGANKESLLHLRSITKNFTSTLIGVSLDRNELSSVELPLVQFFPNLVSDEKKQINISHILNMASGLRWDEDREILHLIGNARKQPVQYFLEKELEDRPGEKWNYNSASTHSLARILEMSTNRRLEELAESRIFTPLNIDRYEWELDPDGKAWGGYGLQLTARDLAKFGLLFLDQGRWGDTQVVSEAWVNQCSLKQIDVGVPGGGYSNQWWCADVESYDHPIYYGMGYGGQGLIIFPDKNMVVVTMQRHTVSSATSQAQWEDAIEKVIRPVYRAAN